MKSTCNGSLMDKLISFALPLMLSGILQLLFNAVDIVVVGRFSGSQALAAVGSDRIDQYLYQFIYRNFTGRKCSDGQILCIRQKIEVSDTVHTAMMFAVLSGIVMLFCRDLKCKDFPWN